MFTQYKGIFLHVGSSRIQLNPLTLAHQIQKVKSAYGYQENQAQTKSAPDGKYKKDPGCTLLRWNSPEGTTQVKMEQHRMIPEIKIDDPRNKNKYMRKIESLQAKMFTSEVDLFIYMSFQELTRRKNNG